MLCFFFFKQKTAYEMRISDWSSDVCSSDLEPTVALDKAAVAAVEAAIAAQRAGGGMVVVSTNAPVALPDTAQLAMDDFAPRSEERRVGKECVSTCRSRWSPDHSKKKKVNINNANTDATPDPNNIQKP